MLTKLINKIGLDKCAHFGIGGLICALFTFVFILQDLSILALIPVWKILLMPTIGSIITFFVSVIKEYCFDSKVDWKDIIAAMIGCVTVFVAVAFGVLIAI